MILHKFLIHTILLVVLSASFIQLTAQTASEGKFPQYLFPDFTNGVIKLKTGQSHTQKINYNTISERMVMQKEGQYLDLINIETIDTIFLQNRIFVSINKSFYEVLVNAPVALFIQHKSDLTEQGSPSGYGGTSQTSAINVYSSVNLSGRIFNMEVPPEYTVSPSPVYWIRKGDVFSSFLTLRQLQKIFTERSSEVKKFIDQNRIKVENKDGLIKLVNFYNEINK
jgi:hypothetical protein